MMPLLVALTAFADIPPPRDYVEDCTVANHASDTVECAECDGYHGGREPCEALEAKGYAQKCQTYGASVWTEVMCRAKGDGNADAATPSDNTEDAPAPSPVPKPAPAPDTKEKRRCSLVGGSASVWLLLPVLAVRRR